MVGIIKETFAFKIEGYKIERETRKCAKREERYGSTHPVSESSL